VSAEQVSVEQVSVEQVSVEQVSVEQVSVEQVSAEQVSAEQVSVEQVSAEQVSAEQVSAEQTQPGMGQQNVVITRPRGRAPTGKEWNAVQGVWVSIQGPVMDPCNQEKVSGGGSVKHDKNRDMLNFDGIYVRDAKAHDHNHFGMILFKKGIKGLHHPCYEINWKDEEDASIYPIPSVYTISRLKTIINRDFKIIKNPYNARSELVLPLQDMGCLWSVKTTF
jgi:hypothetical protein